mmetsp:Transcript_3758/g.7868  ORF Transcript_3758/g.7868 Transcript_3758/m.7868 type:complete len:573 (+) Transcript_3758:133-1851(+)
MPFLKSNMPCAILGLICCFATASAFTAVPETYLSIKSTSFKSYINFHVPPLRASKFEGDDEEETRLKILLTRRQNIRDMLKNAESQRNYRLENDIVPELDPETGEPYKSDSKAALTLTAFVVAAGAVTLRVGGRAALVSAVGLDFANENPELKENMDQFLNYAASLDQGLEALAFVAAWTIVKVFCFDAGGVVLAFSAGILFGGVLQGAVFSAFAATVGSSIAYLLAKVDSPFRNKALELLEEYPSLRGISKVVEEDGLKAVVTLRLAPILPIPIGLYNYVYGVTNVPYLDFAGGIFLGSLKPYLLDSYLGYFGKQVVDGTVAESGGLQDYILLAALGFSVLIGVFASELAGETWDSVKKEIEAEEERKKLENPEGDEDDGITRKFLGFEFPEWVIGTQLALKAADERINVMIKTEYNAAVWNSTKDNPPPLNEDPARFATSPEIRYAGQGFDGGAAICDGFVLSPALIKAYFKYADPLFDEKEELKQEVNLEEARSAVEDLIASKSAITNIEAVVQSIDDNAMGENILTLEKPIGKVSVNVNEKEELRKLLSSLREKTEKRLTSLNEKINE